ncbi:MAG: homocysteine S-methyltransferase family protein [Treponema sp.]|nr:homocysteine S-methyltransferase family protein [Treponema sp.]
MITCEQLNSLAEKRILILDGAMGSLIQGFKLKEADFRGPGLQGGRFAGHPAELSGCNDLLCLTRPEIVSRIHEEYLEAGADIIETCSFNSTAVSLADFGLADLAYEISAASAALARKEADRFSRPEKPRFVAGSMGPTAKSGSISPDINDPGKRALTWDELEAAYYDNARGLLDGGADILLIETVFDTLNAKAAIFAVERLREERRADIPLMISATIAGESGRTLSGQNLEAFQVSVLHGKPWALGLNCSFGADKLAPYIRELAGIAPCLVSAHPNAGLPNQSGVYEEGPASMAAKMEEFFKEGLLNIAGGCCGTTPAHIAAIAEAARLYGPRKIPGKRPAALLAGLKPLDITPRPGSFILVGERANVAGSKEFRRAIGGEDYDEAVSIAQAMLEEGAGIIDVCMDRALPDPEKALTRFLNLGLCFPDFAAVPVMVDSSRWELIEAGLKCLQGKGLANSLSLKEGEAEFLRRARLARRYGAAAVVMLFDERGPAASYQRKIETASRSYALLTGNGFPPEDIVFDPVVLPVGAGPGGHDGSALDFIRACGWIRDNCPGTRICGGISNLSFSFRGNKRVREAMHAVFLKHAVEAGLSMAILNPASLAAYEDIDPELRLAAEDLILNRKPGGGPAAAGRLLELAKKL